MPVRHDCSPSPPRLTTQPPRGKTMSAEGINNPREPEHAPNCSPHPVGHDPKERQMSKTRSKPTTLTQIAETCRHLGDLFEQ